MLFSLSARSASVPHHVWPPSGLEALTRPAHLTSPSIACSQGRALGFDGKTLIHPSTIEPANRVYAPSASEVEHARRVVSAFEQAAAAGSALAVVDGKLVESLHVRESERRLRMAEEIEARERAAADT